VEFQNLNFLQLKMMIRAMNHSISNNQKQNSKADRHAAMENANNIL